MSFKSDFKTKVLANLPDNTTGSITPAKHREVLDPTLADKIVWADDNPSGTMSGWKLKGTTGAAQDITDGETVTINQGEGITTATQSNAVLVSVKNAGIDESKLKGLGTGAANQVVQADGSGGFKYGSGAASGISTGGMSIAGDGATKEFPISASAGGKRVIAKMYDYADHKNIALGKGLGTALTEVFLVNDFSNEAKIVFITAPATGVHYGVDFIYF